MKSELAPNLRCRWTTLAVGAWQHVLVPEAESGPRWVCKIPAAYGRLVPYNHGMYWIRNPYEWVLSFVCYALPRGFQNRVRRAIETITERHWPSASKVVRTLLGRTGDGFTRWGQNRLVEYCRRMRARNFQAMLRAIARAHERGVDGVLLPCQPEPTARIHMSVQGVGHLYQGAALLQRRADRVLESEVDLRLFEWGDLVEAQHQLWRQGLGLASPSSVRRRSALSPFGRAELRFRKIRAVPEILGPFGWAQLDGRLFLSDTSSLTDDYRAVRVAVSDAGLDFQERRISERLRTDEGTLSTYFAFVRRWINQEQLDRLWGTADAASRPSRALALAHKPGH